jgi:hypothetical protein
MTIESVDRPALMRAFLQAFNDHEVDTIIDFFTEDCEFDTPRGPTPSVDDSAAERKCMRASPRASPVSPTSTMEMIRTGTATIVGCRNGP